MLVLSREFYKLIVILLANCLSSGLFAQSSSARSKPSKYRVNPNDPHAPIFSNGKGPIKGTGLILKEPLLKVTEKPPEVVRQDKQTDRKKRKLTVKAKTMRVFGVQSDPKIPFTAEKFTPEFVLEPLGINTMVTIQQPYEDVLVNQ